MLFAVLFEDNADKAEMRQKLMDRHLAFLEENYDKVLSAGPLHDSADGSPAGGLWLVDVESPDGARALVESDPFWPTGLRKSVRILRWTQVFADGRRR